MQLVDLVNTSRQVADTSGRLDKIQRLASCLSHLQLADEIDIAVAYLTGVLRQGRIGIAAAAVRAGLSESPADRPSLSLLAVDQVFERVAKLRGAGSTSQRTAMLGQLFSRATREEQNFLARLIVGELRQGALEGIMVDAVARAANVASDRVRRAAMLAGDLRAVAQAALLQGDSGLARFDIQLFRPIQPMLAQTADEVADALARLNHATPQSMRSDDAGAPPSSLGVAAALEYKLDGARIQVHKSGGDVAVFTRQHNDVTAAVPEVVEHVLRLPAHELILDGEALALKPDGTPHPFQITMRRFGRKLDVEQLRASLPLSQFFFDCLYVDGQSLIDHAGRERFAALSEMLPPLLLIPRIVTGDVEQAQRFLEQAIQHGHEGIMAKSLEAAYEAGSRGQSWLKIKPTHTLDLVVLAAEWGSGRRRGWLSNLHLGARNPADGGFAMVGKTFKGLTDQMLTWQTQKLLELETSRDQYTVYVRAELVVEVAFNEIQTSPRYSSGMALRFARVKRYRPDKQASEVETLETLRAILQHGHRAPIV